MPVYVQHEALGKVGDVFDAHAIWQAPGMALFARRPLLRDLLERAPREQRGRAATRCFAHVTLMLPQDEVDDDRHLTRGARVRDLAQGLAALHQKDFGDLLQGDDVRYRVVGVERLAPGEVEVKFGHAVYLPAPDETVQYTVSVSRDSAVWKTVCPIYPNQRLTLIGHDEHEATYAAPLWPFGAEGAVLLVNDGPDAAVEVQVRPKEAFDCSRDEQAGYWTIRSRRGAVDASGAALRLLLRVTPARASAQAAATPADGPATKPIGRTRHTTVSTPVGPPLHPPASTQIAPPLHASACTQIGQPLNAPASTQIGQPLHEPASTPVGPPLNAPASAARTHVAPAHGHAAAAASPAPGPAAAMPVPAPARADMPAWPHTVGAAARTGAQSLKPVAPADPMTMAADPAAAAPAPAPARADMPAWPHAAGAAARTGAQSLTPVAPADPMTMAADPAAAAPVPAPARTDMPAWPDAAGAAARTGAQPLIPVAPADPMTMAADRGSSLSVPQNAAAVLPATPQGMPAADPAQHGATGASCVRAPARPVAALPPGTPAAAARPAVWKPRSVPDPERTAVPLARAAVPQPAGGAADATYAPVARQRVVLAALALPRLSRYRETGAQALELGFNRAFAPTAQMADAVIGFAVDDADALQVITPAGRARVEAPAAFSPVDGVRLELAACAPALAERYCALLVLPHAPGVPVAGGMRCAFGRATAMLAALRVLDSPRFLRCAAGVPASSADRLGLSRDAFTFEAAPDGWRIARASGTQALYHLDEHLGFVAAIDAATPDAPYRLPAGHHLVAGHYVLRFDA